MHLHFDGDIFWQDINDLLNSAATGMLGYDRHKTLAKRALDPKCIDVKTVKMTVVANCVNCSSTILRDIDTVWQRGSPLRIRLHDGTCPECRAKNGFKYESAKTMHA